MPSLYLFDTEDERWRRPWARMLPAGFIEVRIEADAFRHAGGPARDGVVVAHASRLPAGAARERLWEDAARSGLDLVLISGGAHEPGPFPPHVHARRRRVRTREIDGEFARCLARFWDERVRKGVSCFELLEPERDPWTVLRVLCRGAVLAHDAARPEDAARAAEVVRPDWWGILDTGALRRALASQEVSDTRLERLLDLIEAAQPIPAEAARQALLALVDGR